MALKTVTVTNAVDTWAANVGSATRTRHTETQLGVGDSHSFIYFANPVPKGAKIVSATLRLWTKGSWGGANPILSVQRIATKYTASTLNWTNKPGVTGPTATKQQVSTGDGNLWEWNVAPTLQEVVNGAAWYGFRVVANLTTPRRFRSSELAPLTPQLVITWSIPPARPTRLTPSAGQAVNAFKPVLEMDYSDVSGSTSLAALQVQVDAGVDFVTPDFDSGTVLATGSTARIDLASTAYAGAAPGATPSWRGRVQDSSGEWSPWSAVAGWTRAAKGAVTITSPSSGTPTLSDFTPPVTWTFSLTQSKWQVIVTTANGTEVFNSGERAGTDTQVTVASSTGAAVLTTGVTYAVEVRCWDNLDRIGTVGDPAYSTLSRTFTVVTSAGVTAPSSLVSTPSSPVPGVVLTWQRVGGAPDAFTILRDGVPIEANIEPSEVSDGSGGYVYTLSNMRPNIAQTIAISAIVNGIASTPTTVAANPKVSGLWLIDKAEPTTYLALANTSGTSFVLGEDGETMTPLGASAGIRITQGLRGYEGTVTGSIIGEWGKTRDQWYEIALKMRSRPGRAYRLVVGTEVFDCVIWNMNPRPTGDSQPAIRPCSFEFMQTGVPRVATVL